MQVSLHNKVKTYNLTAGKSLPEWISERKKNKRLAGGEHRIELIHDLEFPHFARTIFRTANGTHLFAAGDYPPRIKCFDVNQLSMKYSFNADMPILGGVALSPDFRKFALRGEGRQITVHHSASIIDRVRVPHTMRSLAYHPYCAELLSSGTSHEIFRLSLETGAFVESYKTQSADGVNHVEVFKNHGLIMCAGADGVVEAWDSRAGSCAARLTVAGSGAASGIDECCELRHIATDDESGLLFSCGTESGHVLLYDLRLHKPLIVKDHMNSLPIVKTYFFQGRSTSTGEASHVLSADTRSLKVWNKKDGSNFTSIEAPADITDFCVLRSQHNMTEPYECSDSGVICICCDAPRVQVHFIPQLGVAPQWASFLEILTEELEEKEMTTVYDDYTFVSKSEMDALGMTAEDLAGGKVRPVMHGAFIENRLYRELKAVVDPGEFNRYVQENARRKKEQRWENRISKFKRVADDEAAAADGEAQAAHDADAAGVGAKGQALAAAKADPRFQKAFAGNSASSFALDPSNPEYAKLLQVINERRAQASRRRQRYESELFTIVPDAEGQQRGGDNDDEDDGDEDEEVDARRQLKGVQSSGKQQRGRQRQRTQADAASGSGGKQQAEPQRQVTLYEVKKGSRVSFTSNDKAIHASRKRQRLEKLPLEERLRRMSAVR
ncbi:ribosome biogenesis protein ENP2 [Trypanosoma conorhini]|uniref:Ribosome biogenesis protein ENP2 n=1 Tax=Trypanosoma conorhini TaxID=83891 RepID=A0A422QBN3_9TRYP|nr:ribosome biogenesis protein ENP2 [Trypanosoma conorhini]RNF27367.1 ribosome biogenesis protein ENP2 [Trypanosoma conorhini]